MQKGRKGWKDSSQLQGFHGDPLGRVAMAMLHCSAEEITCYQEGRVEMEGEWSVCGCVCVLGGMWYMN